MAPSGGLFHSRPAGHKQLTIFWRKDGDGIADHPGSCREGEGDDLAAPGEVIRRVPGQQPAPTQQAEAQVHDCRQPRCQARPDPRQERDRDG